MRGWIPAILAVALALAPVSLDACEVTCVTHAHVGQPTPAGHGMHHHAAATAAASLQGHHHQQSSLPAALQGHHHQQAPHPAARPGHHQQSPNPVTITSAAAPHPCAHDAVLPITGGAITKVTVQAPALVSTRLEAALCPIVSTPGTVGPPGTPFVPPVLNPPLRI